MITVRETTIKDVQYKFTPLMATPARGFWIKLTRRYGPTGAAFLKGLGNLGDLKNLGEREVESLVLEMTEAAGCAVDSFTQSLSVTAHNELVEAFLSHVSYFDPEEQAGSGGWIMLTKNVREVMFATQLGLETRILYWCLQEQYSDFFEPLRTAIASAGALLAEKASNLSSPKESNGASGESSQIPGSASA